MNTQRILDELLGSGRQMAERGEDYAARKLGVGDDAQSRSGMMKGAMGGALAAGALTLLLGSRTGRSIAKIGGLAALGGLAYNAYKNASASKGAAPDPAVERQMIQALPSASAEKRSRALLAAMIGAAKADGHIDAQERAIIETRMRGMDGVDGAFLKAELEKPLDPTAIAAMADGPQGAREIYAMSALVLDIDHPAERLYLKDLARSLRLEPEVAADIEDQVKKLA